ncbi:uncharacterized protein BP5553_07476 [Venustampulla echinocandica]|uniref:Heterokaryon incompatibility domain-containing protein n=1 Tax=Venustampulla echinocandica TaxID=2656787 RepID=A0A370TGN1_9HELO|nr:uncharacterized protein BP5553_07476 [Venustampulla echinocandica]RDL34348.1 hypothetical protein BP5553_07476 [Venustampulla echinocandica]
MHLDKARIPLISAYLSEIYVQTEPSVYRLDFKSQDYKRVGTFVLQQTGDRDDGLLHTPFSASTSSDEVLEVARGWIHDCLYKKNHDGSKKHAACPGIDPQNPWYPTRLIDLGLVADSGKPGQRVNPEQVRLVVTNEDEPKKGDVYVTLSHCWGKANFLRLEEGTISEFQKGIRLETLPKTFRHAISFARRLGRKVRYIWIDSLCIIQGQSDAQRRDWLNESAKMYEIYKNSYCNISATAATDSEQGLFFDREPRELWEDEINLNVDGIPGNKQSHKHPIKRCSVLDLSFWERNVDDAPVNRRAWVLQERLMAPRVLHFCQNQIAWECGKLDASESFRDGLPSYRLNRSDVVPSRGLKGLPEPELNGQNLCTSIAVYQRWKRVVEVYSKTKLTNPSDKLIALSGIAKMMSKEVGETYVAGLWKEYLASQLLWRVDPVYENGVFNYPSKRPELYRAPSFSWAAVDAPQGILYGEITNEGLLIEVVEDHVLPPPDTTDKFGLVQSGHVKVKGILKKIEMRKDPKIVSSNLFKRKETTRYAWRLDSKLDGLTGEWYSNVFLDSPNSDLDIFGPEGNLYCLPAQTDSEKYLICLLLQLEKKESMWTKSFRRIGTTKIPPYNSSGQKRVLALSGDELAVPDGNWDARAKRHTIRIV